MNRSEFKRPPRMKRPGAGRKTSPQKLFCWALKPIKTVFNYLDVYMVK
jgi:hypothetical protein